MSARIRLPATAKKGEVIEIKTLVTHIMETGQRRNAQNQLVPRKILNKFVCTYNGQEVFKADLAPAISANPYLAFFVTATESGTLDFVWTDDDGSTIKESAKLTVA
jgi:sulfur-oxidizing protein SoxZ